MALNSKINNENENPHVYQKLESVQVGFHHKEPNHLTHVEFFSHRSMYNLWLHYHILQGARAPRGDGAWPAPPLDHDMLIPDGEGKQKNVFMTYKSIFISNL